MKQLCNRFFHATTLCTGDRAIKSRLTQAWIEQLDDISPSKLPRPIRKEFEQLRSAMYVETPLADEHAAQASVRKMSARQAATHAATIVSMFRELVLINNRSTKITRRPSQGKKADVRYERDNSQLLN
jgi:hypothetical protein